MILTRISPLKRKPILFRIQLQQNYSFLFSSGCESKGLHGTTEKKLVDYLVKVIKPAGMNFPELRNLSPITTVKVPEVPAFPQWKQNSCCHLCKDLQSDCRGLNHSLLTERKPDIPGILRCQISTDCSQQAE